MNILCNKIKIQTDVYRYEINQGGDLDLRVSNDSSRFVEIIFVDGKLSSVDHDLNEFNLRSDWRVYGAIDKKIEELEAMYAS